MTALGYSNQPRVHRATAGDLIARDDRLTVAEQLGRICFYGGRETAQMLSQIDWATDEQKLAASRTHAAMTTGHDGWATL